MMNKIKQFSQENFKTAMEWFDSSERYLIEDKIREIMNIVLREIKMERKMNN